MAFFHRLGRFNPTKIPNCALWLEADRGITLDGSNNVSAWADQSGNGRHVSQATDSYRPAYVANHINGYPAIGFNNKRLVNASVTLSSSFTVTVIFNASVNGKLFSHAPWNQQGMLFYTTTPPTIQIWRSLRVWQNYTSNWGLTGNKIVQVEHNGTRASLKMFVNNQEATLTDGLSNDVGISNATNFLSIGCEDIGITPLTGNIIGIIMHSPMISAQNRLRIASNYSNKYAIALAA